jgi:hypothetical protein
MPTTQPQTISVVPSPITSSIDQNVAKVRINGFSQFDPHTGITAQVTLLNSANQIIKPAQIRISGDAWQNWPCGQTQEQDNVRNIILAQLGLTAIE